MNLKNPIEHIDHNSEHVKYIIHPVKSNIAASVHFCFSTAHSFGNFHHSKTDIGTQRNEEEGEVNGKSTVGAPIHNEYFSCIVEEDSHDNSRLHCEEYHQCHEGNTAFTHFN